LLIFLKAPRPGTVKTRLAQDIGPEAATQIYRQLTERVLETCQSIPSVELWFSPADAIAEIEPWQKPGWTLHPQSDGDLGQRMLHAMSSAFSRSAQRVLVIGTDCPYILRADIETAWAGLTSHDLVLGPAEDGGYWLIGTKEPQPTLFEAVPWSTADVFQVTLDKADALNLKTQLLPTYPDIDTLTDWTHYQTDHITAS
jgi:uncharacterized protein